MALTASEVRVAGTGSLSLAPLGTTLPVNPSGALDEAFKDYGYTTEDGVTLTRSIEREGIPAWQAISPVRYVITGQELTIQANLVQSNADTFKLWLNSGDFAQIGVAQAWKAEIPVSPSRQQFAMVLEWSDAASVKVNRLAAAVAELVETGDVTLQRGVLSLPITLSVLPPDTGSVLATFLSNDTAFDPAA